MTAIFTVLPDQPSQRSATLSGEGPRGKLKERDMFGIGIWELLIVAAMTAVPVVVIAMIVAIFIRTRKL